MFFGTRTMPSTDSYWDKLDRLSEAFAAADAVLIGGGAGAFHLGGLCVQRRAV